MAKIYACFNCGADVCKGKSPRTGKQIYFNLDGTEHWPECTEERRREYSLRKRQAHRVGVSLDRRLDDLMHKDG